MCLTLVTLTQVSVTLAVHIRVNCCQFMEEQNSFTTVKYFWMSCVLEFSRETGTTRDVIDMAIAVDVELRFSVRTWLMRLWRLRSPKICSWQSGDLGKLTINFQPKCKGLRTRRADGIFQSDSCLSEIGRGWEFPFAQPFILSPIHIGTICSQRWASQWH